jgi:hypothetical protein
MKHFKSALLLVAATLGSSTAGFVGAAEITTVVTPLTDNVTYSTNATSSPARPALTAYVGYLVKISNTGFHAIDNVRFTGATSVTYAHERATFSSVDGISTCQTGPTSVDCTIGPLHAGESFPTFAVFFKAPVKSVAAPASDNVAFSGITYYAERTGGPHLVAQNLMAPWTAGSVLLGTLNPALISTAVPSSGGTFFTGDGGLSVPASPFTTTAVVPAASTYTTAEITVAPLSPTENCNNFSICYGTQITIPGTFVPYLRFVLRVDSSNIKHETNIHSVILLYAADPSIPGSFVPVGDCASPTTPSGNVGQPCIAVRKYYKNRSTPGWTPELDHDFEWTILNTRNGGYKIN